MPRRLVDQGRLAAQHPFAAQVHVGIEVRLIGEEQLGAAEMGCRPQQGVLAHEGGASLSVGFDQALLGALEHEVQTVQVVQAATATERVSEPTLHKLTHHLPIPIRQVDARRRRWRLDRRLQLGLLLTAQGGGDPPVCSNIRPAGPACRKFANHSPIVCGSRSSASATRAADQPSASSHRACQRSRSRGVGARYIRSRTAFRSNFHCFNLPSTSFITRPRHVLSSPTAYRRGPACSTLALVF